MKFTTEIYRDKTCFDKWNWKIKFVDDKYYKHLIKELPLYRFIPNYTASNNSIEGLKTTLEIAEKNLDNVMNIIKKETIEYKKQKELEAVGQKLWKWNDEYLNFEEVKGGC